MKRRILNTVLALCAAITVQAVNVNFFVGSKKIRTVSTESGVTFSIPDTLAKYGVNMPDSVCRENYSFSGWKVGSRVTSDEDHPTLVGDGVTDVINPTYETNLYAVFHNDDPDKVNSYVRISSTNNLIAGDKYLIICFYVYGNQTQYYAMTSQGGTYKYNGTTYNNRINARRLYPHNGMITGPEASVIWTLDGTPGAWKWKNEDAIDGKDWLYIGASDEPMLVAEGSATSCVITQANGIFTIRNTANNKILKYVDDYITEEDDYFITGDYTDYVIYLYKKESPYTCYPDCDKWTVNLDAMNGTVNGTSPASSTASLTEADAGDGVTLPGATVANWDFVKWKIDEPLDFADKEPADLVPTGPYDPLYNGMTLYAVYTGTGTATYYERITPSTTLYTGDTCIIVNYDENKAVSTNWTSGAVWDLVPIIASGGIILNSDAEAAGDVEWIWTGSLFQDEDGNQLRYGRSTSYNPFTPYSAGSPYFYLRYYYSSRYWYLYDNGSVTAEERNPSLKSKHKFCIYRKTRGDRTVFTSYPHSTRYTIHLHACGGTIDGEANAIRRQGDPLAKIPMPEAIPSETCKPGEWEFVGWFPGEEKASFEHVEFTDCIAKDSLYFPTEDNMDFYAVYRRVTDRFRIIDGVDDIGSGDTYLLTYYHKLPDESYFDYTLSSQTKNGNLKGLEYRSPRDGTGFYIETDDSTAMWTINKVGSYWTFQNLQTDSFLNIGYGTTSTTLGANAVYLQDRTNADWAMYVYNSSYYLLYCNEGEYLSATELYDQNGDPFYPFCYIYRRTKEYSSWPHCEKFQVYFDACGGTAELPEGRETLIEDSVYAGVRLPDAYANADCGKEGWTFAGWSTIPVEEETNLLSVDIFPPKSIFHPVSQEDTLYAVYYQKTNHYKRISTAGRLHTGVNYIIATSTNKALANTQPTDSTIASINVSPDAAQIITIENPNIDWKLGGVKGAYELYNVLGEDTVYLDLSKSKKAVLSTEGATDNFDITYDSRSYRIRSCISTAHGTGRKYLGTRNGTTFASVDSTAFASLYIYMYRQQATYNSYPTCIEDIDPVKWAYLGEGISSVIVESYHLKDAPSMHGAISTTEVGDGTYQITYRNSVHAPCTNATVEWDGVTSRLRIPYIISDNVNLSSVLTTANDCSECDVYIMPKKTLTVTETDTIRKVTVPDSATLSIANTKTLRTNILALYSEGDQLAPEVNLNTSGSLDLRNTELYRDMRVDENRYYWFTLPYPAKLKEISYVNEAANGSSSTEPKIPRNRVDYWVKFYNGALRAEDANGGEQAKTYWKQVAATGADYTLQPGQGYEIGIVDQADITQADGKKHTKRTIRFTMSPSEYAAKWLSQERNNDTTKTSAISPSTCSLPNNYVHAGWNLIGNPYLRTYNTSTGMLGFTCLRNGAWKKQYEGSPERWTGYWELDEGRATDVPYFTIPRYIRNFDDTRDSVVYEQVLVSEYGKLRPGQAVFVQINSGDRINFTAPKYLTPMPVRRRMLADEDEELPVRTGIVITGADRKDKTGFVFSDEYTTEYEIGADLMKWDSIGSLKLYSFNVRRHKLAFNGMSEEDAIAPIPLGVCFPQDGEYTFAFDAALYKGNDVDTIMLIDYQENEQINLKYADYTFSASKGTNNTRFALLIRLSHVPQTPTGTEQTCDGEGPRKVIINDHLFILRDDEMYNAVGTRVK